MSKTLRQKLCALSRGGVTCGWMEVFGGINFAQLITTFLATLFSALVSALLGGGAGAA